MDGEKQYDKFLGKDQYSLRLGSMRAFDWFHDSKRLSFTSSRYKFVSKILFGASRVLEIGSGDAFLSKIVADVVNELHITDFDERFIQESQELYKDIDTVKVYKFNPIENINNEKFNAVFMLDVLEHIEKANENKLFANIKEMLLDHGIFISGMPSLESQQYASESSKEGHVNCQSAEDILAVFRKHFHNTLIFSMNDEVVHTGFSKMAHYVILIGISPIRTK